LKIIRACTAHQSEKESRSDSVDQPNQNDRANNAQRCVVSPCNVVGQAQIILSKDQGDHQAERHHRSGEGVEHEVVEVGFASLGEPRKNCPAQKRQGQSDG